MALAPSRSDLSQRDWAKWDAEHEGQGSHHAAEFAAMLEGHTPKESHSAPKDPKEPPVSHNPLTGSYGSRDLHAEGEWPKGGNPRYGAITFDSAGRVLLREPTNHFDGYAWTFPKGGPDNGEHPADTALRETLEETGHAPQIVGHVPGAFRGGTTSSTNHFYLATDTAGQVDRTAMEANGETNALKWATPQEALNSISQSTNLQGRYRDLQTLQAAYEAYGKLHPELSFPKIVLPPPPPKPKPYFKTSFSPGDKGPGDSLPKAPSSPKSKVPKLELSPSTSKPKGLKGLKQTQLPKWLTKKGSKTAAADEAFWKNSGKTDDHEDLETRDWKKWHEEHPYEVHPRTKNETAEQYDERIKSAFAEHLAARPTGVKVTVGRLKPGDHILIGGQHRRVTNAFKSIGGKQPGRWIVNTTDPTAEAGTGTGFKQNLVPTSRKILRLDQKSQDSLSGSAGIQFNESHDRQTKNARAKWEGATEEDRNSQAIAAWTTSFRHHQAAARTPFEDELHRSQVRDLPVEHFDVQRAKAQHILRLLQDKTARQGTLHRGVFMTPTEVQHLTPGKTFALDSASWSKKASVANGFAHGATGTKQKGARTESVIFHAASGAKGLDISALPGNQYAEEREVISGGKFHIDRVENRAGTTHAYVSQQSYGVRSEPDEDINEAFKAGHADWQDHLHGGSRSIGDLETRDWKKWHEEHPYVPHPRAKGESAAAYDARLKSGFQGWMDEHGKVTGPLSSDEFKKLSTKHGIVGTRVTTYNNAAVKHFQEATHGPKAGDEAALRSEAAKHRRAAGVAKSIGESKAQTVHLAAAHAYTEAAKQSRTPQISPANAAKVTDAQVHKIASEASTSIDKAHAAQIVSDAEAAHLHGRVTELETKIADEKHKEAKTSFIIKLGEVAAAIALTAATGGLALPVLLGLIAVMVPAIGNEATQLMIAHKKHQAAKAALAGRDDEELETRDWKKWHEEHPYLAHPRAPGQSAADYDKQLKDQFDKYVAEQKLHTESPATKYLPGSPKHDAFTAGHKVGIESATKLGMTKEEALTQAGQHDEAAINSHAGIDKARLEGLSAGLKEYAATAKSQPLVSPKPIEPSVSAPTTIQPGKVYTSTRVENHSGTSDKFYESTVIQHPDGTATHHTAYGSTKPGAHVSTASKEYSSTAAAVAAHIKVMDTRKAHGYSYQGHVTAAGETADTTVVTPKASASPAPKPLSTAASLGMDHTPKNAADLSTMQKISGPLGSNGGQWYKAADGSSYLVKPANSNEHAYNEVAMGKVYEAAGITVPHTTILTNGDGSLSVVSKKIEGLTPLQGLPTEKVKGVQGFGIDVLTANHDVAGLTNDNVFKDANGNVVRIDIGGAGKFRAMGAVKVSWGKEVVEDKSLLASDQGKFLYGSNPDPLQVKGSLQVAANLNLENVDQKMQDAGIPKAHREEVLNTLASRQADIQAHLLAATVYKSTVQPGHVSDSFSNPPPVSNYGPGFTVKNEGPGGKPVEAPAVPFPKSLPPEIPAENKPHYQEGFNQGYLLGKQMAANGSTVHEMQLAAFSHYNKGKKSKKAGEMSGFAQSSGMNHGIKAAAAEHKAAGGPLGGPNQKGGVKASVSTPSPQASPQVSLSPGTVEVAKKDLKPGDVWKTKGGTKYKVMAVSPSGAFTLQKMNSTGKTIGSPFQHISTNPNLLVSKVVGGRSTPKPKGPTKSQVMAKNLKAGDQILIGNVGHTITATNSMGTHFYVKENGNPNAGESDFKPGLSTTKVTKIKPGHAQFSTGSAQASAAKAAAGPGYSPSTSGMPSSLKAKAQPIHFTGDTASNGEPFHQHPGYHNDAYDAAYSSASTTAPPDNTEMAKLDKAQKDSQPGTEEAAIAKGKFAGAMASQQEWAKTHKSEAKKAQEKEFIEKVNSFYTSKTPFEVKDTQTPKTVPDTIPHGTKPAHATTASEVGYNQAIAQGYDQAIAAHLQGKTPEQINGAAQGYLDQATALGQPSDESGIIDQAHLAGLAQGAGKAAVDLKKNPDQHPNASSKSIIHQGVLADKSGHGAYTSVQSGNPYKNNQSDTQLSFTSSELGSVGMWKANYRYSHSAMNTALDKMAQGHDPGNGQAAKAAKQIAQMYIEKGEPNKQAFQRKLYKSGMPASVIASLTTVGNKVDIPLTSWSTDPNAWSGSNPPRDFWIHAPAGTVSLDVGRVVNYDSEVETISAGKFQVESVKKVGAITHVYLKQLEAFAK